MPDLSAELFADLTGPEYDQGDGPCHHCGSEPLQGRPVHKVGCPHAVTLQFRLKVEEVLEKKDAEVVRLKKKVNAMREWGVQWDGQRSESVSSHDLRLTECPFDEED